MTPVKLVFPDITTLKSVLGTKFTQLTDESYNFETPLSNEMGETFVVVTEPTAFDEEGNELPKTWVGIHIDILVVDPTGYEAYATNPSTPVHVFAGY